MDLAQMLTNVLTVVIYVGVPVLALLVLAVEMGRWYATHPDPPEMEKTPDDAPEH